MQHAELRRFLENTHPIAGGQLVALGIADRIRTIGTVERTAVSQLGQEGIGPVVHGFRTMRLRWTRSARHSTTSARRVASSISYCPARLVMISWPVALASHRPTTSCAVEFRI